MSGWTYKGKFIVDVPYGSEGFVYLITYKDGERYLGKKSFWSRRKLKVKGSLRKKLTVKESDWRDYRGSSKSGIEKAARGEVKDLEIIHFADSKGGLMFLEVKEMILRDVLCDDSYLNANILLRIYKCFKPMKMEF